MDFVAKCPLGGKKKKTNQQQNSKETPLARAIINHSDLPAR